MKDLIVSLTKQLNYYNHMYYVNNTSVIPDNEYDALKRMLIELEKQYPEYVQEDSPTHKVGAPVVSSQFNKITRSVPMISLKDIFSAEDVDKFINDTGSDSYAVEPKIDGLGIELIYKNGILVSASTRGDGTTGEDVLNNAIAIKDIPNNISYKKDLTVRGEVYVTFSNFNSVNSELESCGKKTFANPRNYASGSLRQLDPTITANRRLSFKAYQVIGYNTELYTDSINFIKALGFKTVDTVNCSAEEVKLAILAIEDSREILGYPIDGAVIKVNNISLWKKLGTTSTHPRYAVAYKFEANKVATTLEDIVWQTGRTGEITPVAVLKPVNLSGVTVQRASLHNYEKIKEKNISIGDIVIIQRAGDVIPEVVRSMSDKPTTVTIPETCPACGHKTVYDKPKLFCNNPDCSARLYDTLCYISSKQVLDITFLGKSLIKDLIDNNKITEVSDILYLTKEDLLAVPGVKDKKASKILASINKVKQGTKADRFVASLCIYGIGKTNAPLLLDKFKTIERLEKATLVEIMSIQGIGSIRAKAIVDYFKNPPKHYKVFKKEINIIYDNKVLVEGGPLLVFTGKLSQPRSKLESLAKSKGCKTTSVVSKKIDYLVCGEKPGSKLAKAKKLGVTVITEKEFYELIGD